jgi:UDP-glucuronate decarboxylase
MGVFWYRAGVRSCYDEGKRTAETLAMDYHRGADVQVQILELGNWERALG